MWKGKEKKGKLSFEIRTINVNIGDQNVFLLRKLLKLKEAFLPFLKCSIGDGMECMFWFENWRDFGPLLTFIGDPGPRDMRIHMQARVEAEPRN